MKRNTVPFTFIHLAGLFLLALLLVSCQTGTPAATATPPAANPIVATAPQTTEGNSGPTGAYPGPETATRAESAYPGPAPTPEGLLPEPPNPERSLPSAGEATGVVGGVLVREVVGQGYLPLMPRALFLGEIVHNSAGEPTYLSQSVDSPQAQLFQTGVFIFNSVPPGDYGLIVDLGFAQFPVRTADGNELLVTVEAGKALDMGQVFVSVP
ncbi:MAG: hypothetical protein AB1791_08380 [Chloroflexota bacterium]